MDAETQRTITHAVVDAASSAEVVNALTRIYAEIQQRISQIGPVCEMSGRCCRFEEYGHRLYVTTAELAAFVAMARQTPIAPELVGRADGGSCRFQQGKLCMVHQLRPMGCRMFYCDPRTEEPLQELFEQFHTRLKRLHEELHVPYYYLEWRSALAIIEPLLKPEPTPPADSPRA